MNILHITVPEHLTKVEVDRIKEDVDSRGLPFHVLITGKADTWAEKDGEIKEYKTPCRIYFP